MVERICTIWVFWSEGFHRSEPLLCNTGSSQWIINSVHLSQVQLVLNVLCALCVPSRLLRWQCIAFFGKDWNCLALTCNRGWVGLWGFLWWAPSAKRKDHHGVSSGWSSVWHRSNTGLSSTQYEQIPIILGVWPFWLTPFFFRSITFWQAYG